MTVQIRRWQFTVADFARMVEAGILAEDDRVELIDGEVRAMSPSGPRHVAIVNRLNALLSRQVADSAISACRTRFNSLTIPSHNQTLRCYAPGKIFIPMLFPCRQMCCWWWR